MDPAKLYDPYHGSEHPHGARSIFIGTNMLDCHPEPARTKMRELLDTQRTNVYTIEKRGQKKLVYQTPWYQDGQYRGFVEPVLEIPSEKPNFYQRIRRGT
jgi:hypothetical protein